MSKEKLSELLKKVQKNHNRIFRDTSQSEAIERDRLLLNDIDQLQKTKAMEVYGLLQTTPELRQLIEDLQSDRKLRKELASRIFWFLVGWSICLFIILACNDRYLKISESILEILTGGTTIQIIGLVWVMVRGLFIKDRKYKID